jgi:hypothetical protein
VVGSLTAHDLRGIPGTQVIDVGAVAPTSAQLLSSIGAVRDGERPTGARDDDQPALRSGRLDGTSRLKLARMSRWNKIARCESGGQWHINTGTGYCGGLRFSLRTWRSVPGDQFARYPHRTSKGEQITVANRLHAKRGFRPRNWRHVL